MLLLFSLTLPTLPKIGKLPVDQRGQQLSTKTKMAATCRHVRALKFPLRSLVLRAFCSHETPTSNANVPPFDNLEVQKLLKKITGRNLDKIFAARKQGLDVPSYKLMTDAEFLEVRFSFSNNLKKMLR